MRKDRTRLFLAAILAGAASAGPALADDAQIQRGKYLVTITGCSDCHTPGGLLGQPDMARYLGGSDVGFAIPGVGIYLGSNLTPDNDTGLGRLERRSNHRGFENRQAAGWAYAVGSDALPGPRSFDR